MARRATCSRFMSLILYKKSGDLHGWARSSLTAFTCQFGALEGYTGECRARPGSRRGSVSKAARRARGHMPAIAKSTSRLRARLTARYRSALTVPLPCRTGSPTSMGIAIPARQVPPTVGGLAAIHRGPKPAAETPRHGSWRLELRAPTARHLSSCRARIICRSAEPQPGFHSCVTSRAERLREK